MENRGTASNTRSTRESDMDSDTSSEFARVNRIMLSKKSDEYRQRRERNNAAVKKSRFKSKQKTMETQKRVEQLKDENAQLERRLESLSREFNLMRDIFIPRRPANQQPNPAAILNQQDQPAHLGPTINLNMPSYNNNGVNQ